MDRQKSLFASAALHAGFAIVAFLLGLSAPGRSDLPPVYAVNLVSAAELTAPQPTRPEPAPEEEADPEEEIPEPEAKEKIPEPGAEPPAEEKPREAGRQETPRTGPGRGIREGVSLPVTLEGRPFQFPWYLEEMVRKVERNWRPPGTTSLKTTIYFRIDRSGRVQDVKVETRAPCKRHNILAVAIDVAAQLGKYEVVALEHLQTQPRKPLDVHRLEPGVVVVWHIRDRDDVDVDAMPLVQRAASARQAGDCRLVGASALQYVDVARCAHEPVVLGEHEAAHAVQLRVLGQLPIERHQHGLPRLVKPLRSHARARWHRGS